MIRIRIFTRGVYLRGTKVNKGDRYAIDAQFPDTREGSVTKASFKEIAPEIESVPVLLDNSGIEEAMNLRGVASDENCSFRILVALRRIMHFVDAYSKKLAVHYHITGPQLICLYSIVREGPMTLSDLGRRVSLSMSTVNGIIDRLDYKGLVVRERKDRDRRKVMITATEDGRKLTSQAPLPLQDRLAQAIAQLPEQEQVSIALSFERVVEMMEVKS